MAETIGGAGFSVKLEQNYGGNKRCDKCTQRGPLYHLVMPKSTIQRYPETGIKVRHKDYWLCADCYAEMCAAMENEKD